MDKLPICKLCGSEPIQYERIDAVMCSGRRCAMSMAEVTAEEWKLLMGEDRDAVRIEFLAANATMVSGRRNTGIYMLDDVLPYFESEREQCTADSLRAAIDYQMKEQSNGN